MVALMYMLSAILVSCKQQPALLNMLQEHVLIHACFPPVSSAASCACSTLAG
jgi:hypothetical protein